MDDVSCGRCSKLLAQRQGNKIVIKSGKQDTTIFRADVVLLRCPRCAQIVSIEPDLTVVV